MPHYEDQYYVAVVTQRSRFFKGPFPIEDATDVADYWQNQQSSLIGPAKAVVIGVPA